MTAVPGTPRPDERQGIQAYVEALHAGIKECDRLRARIAEVEAENERLRACDCAASQDGNPHHQGFCRSLSAAERRARAKRFAENYSALADGARSANQLAREIADARDEADAARAEVEDWRDRWAIVDEDRTDAQDRAERAEAEREEARAALAQRDDTIAKVRQLAEQWRNVTPAGFYPEASAHANAIENCGDALVDLLDDLALPSTPEREDDA